MRIRCPTKNHLDRHPSASIRGSTWRCFACGASGRYDPSKQGADKWGLKEAKSDEEIFGASSRRETTQSEDNAPAQVWALKYWLDFLSATKTSHPLFERKKIPPSLVQIAIQRGIVRIGHLGIYFVYKNITPSGEIDYPPFPLLQVRPTREGVDQTHKYLFIGKFPQYPVFTNTTKIQVLVESPFHVIKLDPHGELGVAACGGVSGILTIQRVVGGMAVIDRPKDVPAGIGWHVIGDIDDMEVDYAHTFIRRSLRLW